jgi:hypothetical protein
MTYQDLEDALNVEIVRVAGDLYRVEIDGDTYLATIEILESWDGKGDNSNQYGESWVSADNYTTYDPLRLLAILRSLATPADEDKDNRANYEDDIYAHYPLDAYDPYPDPDAKWEYDGTWDHQGLPEEISQAAADHNPDADDDGEEPLPLPPIDVDI